MNSQLRKLSALFKLYLADVFAYKAAAVIWVLGDLQVALMMPLVWRSVGGVGGMSPEQVTVYYLVALSVSQFVTCHLLWDIAWDIKEGTFSSLLMRPVSHLASSFSRNLAWRTGKLILFVPVLATMLLAYGIPDPHMFHPTWAFWASIVLGQTMAFLAAYSVAMVALWTTEVTSLFQVYYFPELLLSGRVVPLESMPDWIQRLAKFTHFRYSVGFPTDVLLGKISQQEILLGLGVQSAWLAFFWVLATILFKKGVRQYYGFGL